MELVARESSFNSNAANPKSSAKGLFQFLNMTRENKAYNKGITNWSDPYQQAIAGLRYIKSNYGTPEKALKFWDKNKSY
jgi:SLT domain-containing protein